ncbi:MAG: 1-deoxy-D-xylulose-5-phosphate reductoisomerase [Candidatus Zixiibacteriota bacterium]
MKKRIVILGSSGSIGLSALDIVDQHPEELEVVGLSVHSNLDLLSKQIEKYHPGYVAITDENKFNEFRRDDYPGTELLGFENGLSRLSSLESAETILNAVVGAAGLVASLETVSAGKRLALANKESMVIGGQLINEKAEETGAEIIPVDSEHSAIWQALFSGKRKEVKKIILTGSGGPFRELPLEEFKNITKEQALHHPTWNMGPKITIDSATMMNKGLEILEAVSLFEIPIDKIDVVIHPQSIIHSMVEFVDSSIIAQMSHPDMRLPIVYALFYPYRVDNDYGTLDLAGLSQLTFGEPDLEKFSLLKLAFQIARDGGTYPAVYNAANEIAVGAFLRDTIDFCMIPDIVINTVNRHESIANPTLEDILSADRWGRRTAEEISGVTF